MTTTQTRPRPHRRFIALITGIAIAITGMTSAAPARADEDDVARALAAILGIAIIGAALNDRDDDRDHRADRPRYKPAPAPRPIPPRVSRKLLPQECLRSFRTDRGQVRMFGTRCLQRNYKFVNRLPSRCERRVWTDRGPRYGFGAKCLRREGYQLARR